VEPYAFYILIQSFPPRILSTWKHITSHFIQPRISFPPRMYSSWIQIVLTLFALHRSQLIPMTSFHFEWIRHGNTHWILTVVHINKPCPPRICCGSIVDQKSRVIRITYVQTTLLPMHNVLLSISKSLVLQSYNLVNTSVWLFICSYFVRIWIAKFLTKSNEFDLHSFIF